jgi:monooxygenase
MSKVEHLDVLVVGAGLSGVDAGYRLTTGSPERSWAIFEARDAIGGTWDLFRYPGVRSDSDMTTLGFPFRPWHGEKAIADGADIRDYIADTARAFGIDRRIRMGHRVTAADWSSADARWTVSYVADGEPRRITCGFLFLCSGYYDYAAGHSPVWPAADTFAGRIVHPQFWPQGLSVAGKRVVVIGSGATAVTLLPALVAQGAAHVTMLQRSPTYIASRPSHDAQARTLRRRLPAAIADAAIRWKNIAYGILVYKASRRWPDLVKRRIAAQQRSLLGPGVDIARHLTPGYDPWDQRLCLAPDGDLFDVLRSGAAAIVTDRIERFTPHGLLLVSGTVLAADLVVTATGLKLQMMGGAALTVDGDTVQPGTRLLYKGAMLEGVPNLAFAVGYTNASWTLKCDLTAQYVSRLLNHMAARGLHSAMPIASGDAAVDEPMLDLRSGYVRRAEGMLPRQGARAPWRTHQNYVRDLLAFRTGRIDDGVLKFGSRAADTGAQAA